MALVRHKAFISLKFNCLPSSRLILGDFKVTRCVLVDIITSLSVLQLRLLQTRSCSCLRANINSSIALKLCFYPENKIKIELSLSLTAIEHFHAELR